MRRNPMFWVLLWISFWAVIAVVVFFWATPAPAATLVRPDGTPWGGKWQQWVDVSKIPTVEGEVILIPDECPFYPKAFLVDGCADVANRTVYVKRDNQKRRHTLLHELGHLFDYEVLNDSNRQAFKKLILDEETEWWPSTVQGILRSPSELFASLYAHCGTPVVERMPGSVPGGFCRWLWQIKKETRG